MSHDTSYKKLHANKRESVMLRKAITQLNEERLSIENDKQERESQYQQLVEDQKQLEFRRHVNAVVTSYDGKISNAYAQYNSVESEYRQKLGECTEESVCSELKSKEDFSSDVQMAMKYVTDVISSDIGERFSKEYMSQLESQKVKIDKEDLPKYIDKFYSLTERFDKFRKKSKAGFSNKLDENMKMFLSKALEDDPKKTAVFFVVLIVLLIFTSKIVFLVYLGFVVYMICSNVIKGTVYSKTLQECRIVADNLELIDEMLREEAKAEHASRVSAIEAEYGDKLKDLKSNISDLEVEKHEKTRDAENMFVFDDTAVKEKHSRVMKEFDDRIAAIRTETKHKEDKLKFLGQERVALEAELAHANNQLKDKYLNPSNAEQSKVMVYDFLLDFVDGKTKMFDYPKSSALFLYNNREDIAELMRLLMLQLRIRLNPNSLSMQVWDVERMGREFFPFRGKEKSLFKILSKMDDINDEIEDLHANMMKRQPIVLADCDSLDSYNKKMIELESVTEFYSITFVIDPPQKLLGEDDVFQLANSGPPLGMFFNFFVNLKDINKDYEKLAEKCGKIYILDNGDLGTRSKDYVFNELVTFGK